MSSRAIVATTEALRTYLRAERKRQSMTQVELARLCGISPRFLGELENGRSTAGIGRVLRVCARLGIDLMLVKRGEQ